MTYFAFIFRQRLLILFLKYIQTFSIPQVKTLYMHCLRGKSLCKSHRTNHDFAFSSIYWETLRKPQVNLLNQVFLGCMELVSACLVSEHVDLTLHSKVTCFFGWSRSGLQIQDQPDDQKASRILWMYASIDYITLFFSINHDLPHQRSLILI